MRWRGAEVTNYKAQEQFQTLRGTLISSFSRRMGCRLRGLLTVFIDLMEVEKNRKKPIQSKGLRYAFVSTFVHDT